MERLYDLMLLLDSDAPTERRQEILSSVESTIGDAGGSIETNADWGVRRLSYEIAHRKEAEYHLLQFKGPAELLERLERTLRFLDGIVRFRVIKVKPGTPPAPTPRPSSPSSEAAPEVAPQPEPQPQPEPAPAA